MASRRQRAKAPAPQRRPRRVAPQSRAPRRIAVVAVSGFQSLDVTGPLEVFATANRLLKEREPESPAPYETMLLAKQRGVLHSHSGIGIEAQRAWQHVRGALDTVLVAGGDDDCIRRAAADPSLLRWLRGLASRTRRLGSVCSGAFVLAEAGLLDGRRATTHWASAELLAKLYPQITVEPDAIYVRDGKLVTSAGVTAGMDLALALVEEDLGRDLALAVARQLVFFLKRPGGQSQFSAELEAQGRARGPLESLPAWIQSHLGEELGVERLAGQVAMSPRNFARVFRAQFGATPARYVEKRRVERARRLLEEGADELEAVATSCGFGSLERMRRAFSRTLGVVPAAYRERFAQGDQR